MKSLRFARWISAGGVLFGVLAACAQTQQFVPSKTLEFKAVESDPNFALPSTQVDFPHCLSDGSLVLQTIDWDAVRKAPKGTIPKYNRIVMVIQGKKVQTISSTSITGLTDFYIEDIFPADSGIYLLVGGTKEKPGEQGPGKSPAGVPWTSYRSFVARFDLDGSYKGATELDNQCDSTRSGRCEVHHLAVFPSGDMLVTESAPGSSSLKVLYLKSSGEVVTQIDVPASRKSIPWGDASPESPELQQEARAYLGSVFFTVVGQNIVIWRTNSEDPLVEVTQGGGTREVPLQIPDGYRFVGMTASDDRWVVHLRTENTPPAARMSEDTDVYYEVRPQDGSLAAKLVQTGDIPRSIACESSGTYTAFKMNNAGKMELLQAK